MNLLTNPSAANLNPAPLEHLHGAADHYNSVYGSFHAAAAQAAMRHAVKQESLEHVVRESNGAGSPSSDHSQHYSD